MTYPLLEQGPIDHNSIEFLDFLRANNKVISDGDGWLVIENCKYHNPPDVTWYMAFWKGNKDCFGEGGYDWYSDIDVLWYQYGDWEWIKKALSKQPVDRFHIHLIKR